MKRVMLGVVLTGLVISSLGLSAPAQARDHWRRWEGDRCFSSSRWDGDRGFAARRWNASVNNQYYANNPYYTNPYYAPATNLSLWQRMRLGLGL